MFCSFIISGHGCLRFPLNKFLIYMFLVFIILSVQQRKIVDKNMTLLHYTLWVSNNISQPVTKCKHVAFDGEKPAL